MDSSSEGRREDRSSGFPILFNWPKFSHKFVHDLVFKESPRSGAKRIREWGWGKVLSNMSAWALWELCKTSPQHDYIKRQINLGRCALVLNRVWDKPLALLELEQKRVLLIWCIWVSCKFAKPRKCKTIDPSQASDYLQMKKFRSGKIK